VLEAAISPVVGRVSDRRGRLLPLAAGLGGLVLGFGLINLAWAGGQVRGAAGGGALAQASADAVPFLAVAGLAALSLLGLRAR